MIWLLIWRRRATGIHWDTVVGVWDSAEGAEAAREGVEEIMSRPVKIAASARLGITHSFIVVKRPMNTLLEPS